jgi:putative ABC transport system substrate-binding protein
VNRRAAVGALLSTGALLGLGRVLAQQGKLWRIGFLWPLTPDATPNRLAAFRDGLREFNYVEGRNISIEHRWAEGNYDRLAALAADLVRLNVDLIVTTTTPAAVAAKNATRTIPIVFVNVADPVATGLVASLARPGGNLTGVTNFFGTTTLKQLDLLLTAVPKASRIALLSNPDNQSMQGLIKSLESASEKRAVRLFNVEARTATDLDRTFSNVLRQRPDALLVLAELVFFANRKRVVAFAAKAHLPAAYPQPEYVEVGGLMSYGPDIEQLHRIAARYVDKILRGTKPAELPVEQPNAIELVINRRTAKTLGITLPRELLVSATRVLE